LLAFSKALDRCGFKEAGSRLGSQRSKDLIGEAQQIGHIGKQPGMPRHSTKNRCVFILDLTLDCAVAEYDVFLAGGNPRSQVPGKIEPRCRKFQRIENLFSYPNGKWLLCQDFDSFAQQDESRVGILGSFAGPGLKRQIETGAKKCSGSVGRAEELDVSGQPGSVRQQMPQGDVACPVSRGRPTTKPGSNSATGISRSSNPRWFKSMAADVVATTLVRLATSYMVFGATDGACSS